MTNLDIAYQRLHNQAITSPLFENPVDVVKWFGAMQAQDYLGAMWAIGLRMSNAIEAEIEQAIADGEIVRTHPMRDTWHFVAAADVRWLLALLAPRKIAGSVPRYRQLELDETIFARSNAAIMQALQGGKQFTREALAAVLEQAAIATADLRLTYLLIRAQLDGVICSGPRRGKQFTFALLDEVVPVSRTFPRDDALAELTCRYFTSHGPATAQDFAWWSGLTITDAKAGLEMVKPHIVQEVINGQPYWLAPSLPSAKIAEPSAYLLPSYDEYAVAYKDRSAILDAAYAVQTGNGIFNPIVVTNGRIIGTWKRTLKRDVVVIETALFHPLNETETHALTVAIERYGRFIGKPAMLL